MKEKLPHVPKTGPTPEDVKRWILENSAEFTPEEMARALATSVERVTKVLDQFNSTSTDKTVVWRDKLRRSKAWRHIQTEFTDDELVYFSDKYIQLMEQFKDEVLPTEEQQIFNLIRVEILKHRNLASTLELNNTIRRLQQTLEGVLAARGGRADLLTEDDREHIIQLQNQISDINGAAASKTQEFLKLNQEHSNITGKLKASRDQRISNVENNKMTWPEMVKILMDRHVQETESRKFELRRVASEKELTRLTKPHKFMDGQIDLPIIYSESADNLNMDLEEENNE